jgi:hypothetical protein
VTELGPGIYEQLVTVGLRAKLEEVARSLPVDERPLSTADAADRISWQLGRLIERALLDIGDRDRVRIGLEVARSLLERMSEIVGIDDDSAPASSGTVLHAVFRRNPDGSAARIEPPLIPVLDTTLLTNAPGEPTLWSQLRSEIESADQIDVVMAFIRRSGIAPLLEPLRRHCADGKPLRVLTTTYTDSTEQRAIEQLVDLGAVPA